jgi:hypothetical protein
MLFALLILFSAFLIEGIGTYVSVVGLSALFAANPVIIVLAIALDLGKVVTVSFLYKYWKKVNTAMKIYMTIASIVLMIITSTGCFGYLSQQFQHAITSTNASDVTISAMTDEQARLQKRKEEMDAQVAKLPPDYVAGRLKLQKQFAPELDRLNKRLGEIDTQLPKLKIDALKQNADVGPIIYVAQAFNTDAEHAVKWVILTIIFVFDPLAISLLLAGNFLLELRRQPEKLNHETTNLPETDLPGSSFSPTFHPRMPGILEIEDDVSLDEKLKRFDPEKHGGELMSGSIKLSDEQFDDFMDHMQKPGEPTPAAIAGAKLLDSLGEKKVWDMEDAELHAHLGRQKPKELDDSPATLGEVLLDVAQNGSRKLTPEESSQINAELAAGIDKQREVIRLQQLQPPKSSLEAVNGVGADVMIDTTSRSSTKQGYQDKV